MSGVAGLIQTNSRVDVLFTRPGTMAEATTSIILQNVKVLSTGRLAPAGQALDPRTPRSPVVTLVLKPDDAQKLELAKNQGRISLSLAQSAGRRAVAERRPHHHRGARPDDQRAAGQEAARNLNDPKVWQELTKKEEPKKEPEKPRVVVDVYRGDKHVQELFNEDGGSGLARGGRSARVFGPGRLRAWRQTTHARDISLLEGRGELLQFQRDILRVVISEPKIADVVVVSPREVMVNAKGPGKTTLVVWETGADPARYEIDVTKDTSEWDLFRKEILDSANGSTVTVTGSGETHGAGRDGEERGGFQAAGGHGADARQERDQPAAGAARAGAAADSAASEVRGDQPRGSEPARVQSLQHQ